MQFIQTPTAPQPAGHYSQAIVNQSLVFISGQLAIDPVSRKPQHGEIEEQMLLALQNVVSVAEAAGSEKNKILKCTVFITDIAHWPAANEAYARFFGDHRPARSIVPVNPLHHGLLVEVEAIASI